MPKKTGRSKGQGYIFKRGSVYYLQYDVNGSRKVVSLKCTHRHNKYDDDGNLIAYGAEEKAKEYLTPSEAKTKAQMALHIAEARQFISSKKIPINLTWDTFIEKYENEVDRKIKDSTKKNYELQWGRFEKWLDTFYPNINELKEVDNKIAKDYSSHLDKVDKLSASAYNQHRGLLLLVFKTLKEEAGLLENPWEATKRKEKDGIDRKLFTKEEVQKILSFFDDCDIPYKYETRILFYIGAYTGLRLGDCCLIKWSNIDLEKKLIKCIPRKTDRINREVTIPILPELLKILKEFQNKEEQEEYLIPVMAEKYLNSRNWLKKHIKGIFEDCGFKTTVKLKDRSMETSITGFHSFRGSLASDLINNGTPLSIVKKIIGDNLKTLEEHYLQTSDEEVAKAVFKTKSDAEKIKEAVIFLRKKKNPTKDEKKVLDILEGKK